MSEIRGKPSAVGGEEPEPVRTEWKGHYLDGKTARLQAADIRLMKTGLEVTTEAGVTVFWPYAEIRQTQGFYAGEEVRLDRGGGLPETLMIRDRAFVASLHEVGPTVAGRLYEPGRRRTRVLLTLLAALAVIGITAVIYAWGIPALAGVVAARVPREWEEGLGASIVEQLTKTEKRCAEPTRQRMIEEMVARLTAPLPRPTYTFRVLVLDEPVVNAFAAPGGFIVIFRGLLERTRTPEELAGVLAHEIEHVVQRHATKALVQHASTGLLLVALTGDVTGVMAYGLESARVLGSLQYSRLAEEEADREGMRLLLAGGIDPAGMIAFFEGLEQKRGDGPAVLKYLSTHPRTEDRIARLRRLAQAPTRRATKLFDGYDWRDIRGICAAAERQG